MANIFRKKDSYIDRVNRSTFDLSFVNNLTMKFGAITPVCLLPVSFGDSFQINARFNLQLLPTVFPIQTQLYARLHFVYVRTRTLWKDWMSFFGGDESVTPPYIQVSGDDGANTPYFNMSDLQTGTLADYLGVPTYITGTYGKTLDAVYVPLDMTAPISLKNLYRRITVKTLPADVSALTPLVLGKSFGSLFEQPYYQVRTVGPEANDWVSLVYSTSDFSSFTGDSANLYFDLGFNFDPAIYGKSMMIYPIVSGNIMASFAVEGTVSLRSGTLYTLTISKQFSSPVAGLVVCIKYSELAGSSSISVVEKPNGDDYFVKTGNNSISYPYGSQEWTNPVKDNCPFYAKDWKYLPSIPLSALPFRAYEAYYNAFGRDIRNNPFIVNGKPEYNRYVPSVEGAGDTYPYRLHYANWEPDAYTTALQSPQAGVAPLVGITSLGEATFRDAAGTEYHAQLETAEDGDTVTGFQVKSSNAPADVVRNLIGMATSGISISDFRNVNSLQRFLEIRVRQSPRYKNLVKGLFDVNLDYDELMMPEFLGGISDTIPVYKVTQTTPTDGNPLGSFAGQGSLQSGMRHVIRKYCPEDGYILGVMSVVPAANYSQLLPPHFTRMNLLDWHFPQFNNISYQPMLYKHLCPYQAYAINPENVNNVFGYQRAYWDLISSFDEVHGEFRGSMRNFLINRVFDKAPELSQDFLLVNPDHVNDVFSMTSENGDKILGSIAFDITKKTTIPRNSIPHIE